MPPVLLKDTGLLYYLMKARFYKGHLELYLGTTLLPKDSSNYFEKEIIEARTLFTTKILAPTFIEIG